MTKPKLNSREQRLLGLTDFKLQLIDILIQESKKRDGKLTTQYLEALKDGLKDYSNKMEIVETLEENGNINDR